jgi:hypothetical protein
MEHRPYNHEAADQEQRRCEWVSLTHGDVCVRALTVSELIHIQDRAARPKVDPRGGIDRGWAILLQISLSCYDGEGPDAKPIWPASLDLKSLGPIGRLSATDFNAITQAMERVNGGDPEEAQLLKDFSRATEALNSSG